LFQPPGSRIDYSTRAPLTPWLSWRNAPLCGKVIVQGRWNAFGLG
jgi:hypothetical protein